MARSPERSGGMIQPLKQGRLTQEIIVRLTDLILSGQLRAGDYLPREEDLCVQLGASRTAVREAVRVLEARRLVAPKPGVGTIITGSFDEQLADALTLSMRGEHVPATELLEFRQLIEGHAASLAAVRATPDEIAAMQDAVARMAVGNEQPDPVAADVDFHVALATASHNALVALVVRALRHMLR
ncbi:MAG TPA: GntR family transcriptional regulator, partial [Chloroflexota bacterium]|nr:GntR family transcriptional regulator [Chloroflexota bacterium]